MIGNKNRKKKRSAKPKTINKYVKKKKKKKEKKEREVFPFNDQMLYNNLIAVRYKD